MRAVAIIAIVVNVLLAWQVEKSAEAADKAFLNAIGKHKKFTDGNP